MKKNQVIGRLGEEIASKYLTKKGYQILDRNYSKNFGEIDIVAKIKDIIVIIEVKTRKDSQFETASKAVNYSKQNKLKKIAKYYMVENNLFEYNIRFDIIECYWQEKRINHIKNAFCG